MDVVVVESPAKAKTINKYLGSGYTVLASYGHVRDLPPKDGSVKPESDFDMTWQVDERSEKHLSAIAKALKGADRLLLATDPDREGEAISWHVCEVLKERNALDGIDVARVVFHEITKDAVTEAIRHPRQLDRELIDAYLARRALDYLVGFTLSPVLWRKLPGARSAGRVQSVALRLICEREAEIEVFKPREYWTVESDFTTARGDRLTARLTHLDGIKLDRFGLADEAAATAATVKSRACSRTRAAAPAAASSPRSNFSSLRPSRWLSRALNGSSERPVRRASTVQYSRARKVSSSASRSQTRRSVTDWTRPAERLPGSLRHSTGDSVKPTR